MEIVFFGDFLYFVIISMIWYGMVCYAMLKYVSGTHTTIFFLCARFCMIGLRTVDRTASLSVVYVCIYVAS